MTLSFVVFLGALTLLPPGPAPTQGAKAQVKQQEKTKVLLIDHPTLNVVTNYATLAKDKLIDIEHLHVVGIYHASETENYAETQAYIDKNHLTWMSLRKVECQIDARTVFSANTCRNEFKAILDGADGLILNGGADIQPSLYGDPQSMLTQVETPERHVFEVGLVVQALGSPRAPGVKPILDKRRNFPVLGICVGMQTLNVAGGGTLIQDIPVQLYHQHSVEEALHAGPSTWHRNHAHELGGRNNTSVGVMHPIHLTKDAPTFFQQAANASIHEPQVLCVHHQAVGKLAEKYRVYATSDDGKIVEMMGRKDFPNVLGIQFHPERSGMWEREERQLMDPNSTVPNFIYDAMSKEPATQAFNRGVWQWISQRVLSPASK